MRISAFLENIQQGARDSGILPADLLQQLKQEGLESIYMNHAWVKDREIMNMLTAVGLPVEGLWENLQLHALPSDAADAASKALIDDAAALGAKHVLITPGAFYDFGAGRVTRQEAEQREADIRTMIAAIARAKQYGDSTGVAVTLEDYDVFVSPIVFPEILRRFFLEIPGLQCTFDTGNFIPCDVDVLTEFDFYAHRIAALHLKDRVENDDSGGRERQPYTTESGRVYYPAVVGSGDMHIPEILDMLEAKGYTGCCIAEFFGCTDIVDKLTASIRWLKQRRNSR